MIKRRLFIFILVLFIGLVLILTIFYREAVRSQLVVPLLYFSKLVEDLWKSFDPGVLWGAFVIVVYIFVILTFPPLSNRFLSPAPTSLPTGGGRLRFWIEEIQQLSQEQYFSSFSALEIKQLVVEIIAFREHCGPRQAEHWLTENRSALPDEVGLLFTTKPLKPVHRSSNRLAQFWQWWQPKAQVVLTPQPLLNQRTIEAILRYLEDQLEVPHDHRNP